MANVKINDKKSILETEEVAFLGHIIDKNGIRPNKELVKKVLEIKKQENKKELEKFLGLVQFYSRLVPNLAEKCKPLNELKKLGVNYQWNTSAQQAFNDLKQLLASEPCVKPFDVNEEVTLRVDASEYSLGGIMTQKGHPVMYLSRKLTEAETKYSNIEREALGIVWSIERARKLLIGKKFILQTDHEPLKYIFGTKSGLSKTISARLARWVIRLSAFDFTVNYVPGRTLKEH